MLHMRRYLERKYKDLSSNYLLPRLSPFTVTLTGYTTGEMRNSALHLTTIMLK